MLNPHPPEIDAQWYPPGEVVNIHGFRIKGMVYVGDFLPSCRTAHLYGRHREKEPSLITLALDVGKPNPMAPIDTLCQELDDLSYQRLNPVNRATYLQWLADGRQSDDILFHYVWLFYFGLERRLYWDQNVPNAERKVLLEEVFNLYLRFGHIQHFATCALECLQRAAILYPQLAPLSRDQLLTIGLARGDIKFSLLPKYLISEAIKKSEPLGAELAYWYGRILSEDKNFSQYRNRELSVYERFINNFKELPFKDRTVEPNTTTLSFEFKPANPGMIDCYHSHMGLTDPLSYRSEPILDSAATLYFSACRRALEVHRVKKRQTQSQKDFERLMNEDDEAFFQDHRINTVFRFLFEALAKDPDRFFRVSELEEVFRPLHPSGIKENDFSAFLNRLGFTLLPNRKLTGTALHPQFRFCLVHSVLIDDETIRLWSDVIHVAARFIKNAGLLKEALFDLFDRYCQSDINLTTKQKNYLDLFMKWKLIVDFSNTLPKRTIEDSDLITTILRFWFDCIRLEGVASVKNMKLLAQVIKKWQLDIKDFNWITPEPTHIAFHDTGLGETSDFSIPAQPDSNFADEIESDSVSCTSENQPELFVKSIIDATVFEQKLQETQVAQGILGTIFTDEAPAIETKSESMTSNDPIKALFQTLLTQETWQFEDFEDQCKALDFMPYEALERINDLGFELLDADYPIMSEEDGVVSIDSEMSEALFQVLESH